MVSCRLRWRDRLAEIPEIQNINWVRAKRGGEGAGLYILGSDSGLAHSVGAGVSCKTQRVS